MIKIWYTEYFDKFLKQFDDEQQELIKKIIEDYCDNKVLAPRPKHSPLKKENKKVALPNANVVIFYLELNDTWIILDGIKMFDRVA